MSIINLEAALAPELERIELTCFPMANPDDLLSEADIRAYAETFPEGYFVAMVDGHPVGMGAGIFLDFDFDNPQHTIASITGEHQCGNHDPEGEWYYGTDMTVLPEYRGRGIGKMLYDVRKAFVMEAGKRGIIAGGALPGYYSHKREMTIQEYVEKVVAGELTDPTLTFQMSQGFEVRGLLENYIEDESDDGWAALIVWDNQEWAESSGDVTHRAIPPELVEEARRHPDGWVYEIEGDYPPGAAVPPTAIRGGWKVDSSGQIIGSFIANPNFGPTS